MKLSYIVFEVTAACNLSCRYCYNPWKAPGGIRPPRATYVQATRALKRLFRFAQVDHVTFSGGEPLLEARLAELVLYARLKGKGVNVITNGTVGDAERYAQLVQLGVGGFELPLHSPTAAVHDNLVRVPGSHAKVLRSVDQLIALGARVVGNMVVTTQNAHLVGPTLQKMAEHGIREAMVNRFNIGGNGVREASWLTPMQNHLQHAFADADRAAVELGMRLTSGVCTPRCLLDTDRYPHIRFGSCDPDLARRPITLDVAGDLRYCNHSPVRFANIFRDQPNQVAASGYLAEWRSVMPSVCAGCTQWKRCLGGCRAASEQLGLGLDHVDPALRQAGVVVKPRLKAS